MDGRPLWRTYAQGAVIGGHRAPFQRPQHSRAIRDKRRWRKEEGAGVGGRIWSLATTPSKHKRREDAAVAQDPPPPEPWEALTAAGESTQIGRAHV